MSNAAVLADLGRDRVALSPAEIPVTSEPWLRRAPGQAHLVGASGAGMTSLAAVLAGLGWQLTASDAQLHSGRLLGSTRFRIAPGHSPRYLPATADLVIHSTAVPADNCELSRARTLGIRTVSYAELLGQLQQDAQGLCIAGTHGKSTTTALAAAILVRAGVDPTVVLGGTPCGWNTGGRPGHGPHVLVEACEYRSNFLNLHATAAALLNIDLDHIDYFRSIEHLESVYAEFVRRIDADGFLVVGDCARVRQIAGEAACRVVTTGTAHDAAWRAVNVRFERGFATFEVWRHGRRFTEVRLSIAGRHQVANALAAIALAGELNVAADVIKLAVEEFRGVRRRLELLSTTAGVAVLDDYAHHPTAVRASLEAIREMYPGSRVWCVFEPHQVARLTALLDDFAASLHNAGRVLVTDVFCAREPAPPEPMPSRQLVDRMCAAGRQACYVSSFDAALGELSQATAGDVVVTMGAGEVGKIGHAFAKQLRTNTASG